MKKLLKHLTYPIHFTKRRNIAIGNYIIIQRKGGNVPLSKTIPKASIKHPGNNIQLKIKLKPLCAKHAATRTNLLYHINS